MATAPKLLPEFSFRTRQHFWQHLKNNKDIVANVVIVGGGIVGAGIARELGLQNVPLVFLFEKNDFASGTSGASSKLIHAGIRYLEHVWVALKKLQLIKAWQSFRFVLEASRERRILGELAPHLIKPKPIYLVLGNKDPRSVFSVFLGVWFYYFIQLFQGQLFKPPKMVFRPSALKWVAPELDAARVKALFSFWDSETDDARLVIENLQAAHEMGSYALNYVEVVAYERVEEIFNLTLKNKETGEFLILRSKVVINATGAHADEFRHRRKNADTAYSSLVDRVAGSHIDVYPVLTSESYYITAADGRLVFVLKRNEDGLIYTRIGTTERPLKATDSSDNITPTSEEIEYLVTSVKEFFPKASLTEESIVRRDAGIRPLRAQNSENPFHKSREHAIVNENGLYHIIGVKLTDFRRVANELLIKLPWDTLHLRLADPSRSELIALREQEVERAYVEENIVESIRRTMVLHWKDYVERRRGLGVFILKKVDEKAYRHEFETMKNVMDWNDDVAKKEWDAA